MLGTVPPILSPLGTNTGNPTSPNRIDHILVDNTNNPTTTNVAQNVVNEDLPQLFDSRGGSHVTNVPAFDIEDFTSWKDMRLANQDKRLKSIIIACLPIDVMKSVINLNTFTRLKCLLNDLENKGVSIPQAEDNDTDVEEDTRSSNEFLADLNAEFHDRALLANQKRFYKRSRRVGSAKKPMDKSKETCFSCCKLGHIQKDCPSNKISTPSYPSPNKTYNKPKFHSNSTPQINKNVDNHQKDYKEKYKGLKAEIAIFTKKIDAMSKGKSKKGLVAELFDWDDESASSEDEGTTRVKAFMAIAEDEPSTENVNARSAFRVEPIGTSADVITLADLTQTSSVSRETKKVHDKESSIKVTKKKAQTKSSYVPDPCPDKKADSSTEQLLLTLMEEVKGFKDQIKTPLVNSRSVSQSGSSKSTKGKQKTWFGPCKYCRKMENLNEVRVKELRSDNDTEFKNHKLGEFCNEKGISQNFSSPCTPEQNGVAEKRNRTLIETARTILNSTNLPKQFWGEAVNTACYTQTIYIIVKRHGKTAYDVFKGRSLYIRYFHVFGCPMHIHNHREYLGKFDEKADDGFFLGYILVAKAFRVFNIRRQEMKETYHVTFSEDDEAIFKSSTKGDEIHFNENRSFHNDEFLIPRSKVSQRSGNDDYFPYNINSPDESPEFTIADDHPVHNEPDNFESVDNLEPAETLVPVSYGKTIIRTKWIFRNKMDEIGVVIKNKARLVAQGFIQEEMIGFDETFAPIVRLEAIKNFIAYASYMGFMVYQMDVKSFDMKAYLDSDYAGCNLDRKSTSVGCQILGGKLVYWSAKKQSSVAMSSAEAEYVVAAGCHLADYDVLYDKKMMENASE
uniref:Retrovirus-related Pol polyprotein from transposon TNT 1-94 n=1 Tax=Tanacetum cinerariifolium TaxID=118510 RepID=A0A6L2K1P7_TANCI|nr:retrovirus-related Pol polyprotein from transposon TNT 1-94 [Tanacetum cinerariifolium]